MTRPLAILCSATVFIVSAQRVPAPIEEIPEPTPKAAGSEPVHATAADTPAVAQTARAKSKPTTSASDSIRRFNGTWRAGSSSKNQFGCTFSETRTIIIENGTAVFTRELTSTLARGKKWTNLAAPYDSISPIYSKWTQKATEMKMQGSNIMTHWPGNRLIDWTPKTIPSTAFKDAVGKPANAIFVLSGQQLIVTSGKGAVTYSRVR